MTRAETYFHTPLWAIWQMKDYKARNNFIPKTTFWKYLVPMSKCVWKVHHKNWTLQWQKLYQKVILYIVAANAISHSIVTQKNCFCQTSNILYSNNYQKLGKMNASFWKNIWNKGKITLDSFRNFAYVSSYLPLYRKWSFPLRISSVNVTNSTVYCGFGHIYWRNP